MPKVTMYEYLKTLPLEGVAKYLMNFRMEKVQDEHAEKVDKYDIVWYTLDGGKFPDNYEAALAHQIARLQQKVGPAKEDKRYDIRRC